VQANAPGLSGPSRIETRIDGTKNKTLTTGQIIDPVVPTARVVATITTVTVMATVTTVTGIVITVITIATEIVMIGIIEEIIITVTLPPSEIMAVTTRHPNGIITVTMAPRNGTITVTTPPVLTPARAGRSVMITVPLVTIVVHILLGRRMIPPLVLTVLPCVRDGGIRGGTSIRNDRRIAGKSTIIAIGVPMDTARMTVATAIIVRVVTTGDTGTIVRVASSLPPLVGPPAGKCRTTRKPRRARRRNCA
jgi:hypothetical protein